MDAPGGQGGCSASVFGLVWHKQHTYALNTTQPHVFLPPKLYLLQLCSSLLLDLETQVWRGSVLDPFWHPFAFFLREMTKNRYLTNRWVFTLQFFCNDVCLLQEHQNTKRSCNLVQWLIWCGDLAVKSKVHAAAH